jgi:CheY-like chemotaxis protein
MSHEIDDYDYQRYAILFVDDEANTRKYFRRLFGEKFRILEAEDGVQALEVFRRARQRNRHHRHRPAHAQ